MFGKRENDGEKKLKTITFHSLISAILLIVVGLLLLINPVGSISTMCVTIGMILGAIGAVELLIYFVSDMKKNNGNNKLVFGIFFVVAGLFIMIGYRIVMQIVPLVLGLFIVVDGIMKLQTAVNAMKMNTEGKFAVLAIALITTVVGFVICFNAFDTAKILLRIIGAVMIFSGITDVMNIIYISRKLKNYVDDMKALNQDPKDI